MPKLYSAFMLRCWRLGTDAERIEIEHIQTGEKTRVSSVQAALDWIRSFIQDEPIEQGARAGAGGAAPLSPSERPA